MLRAARSLCGNARRQMSTLVVGEQVGGVVADATLGAVAASQKLGKEITVMFVGSEAAKAAEGVASCEGVAKVLTVADASLDHPVAEALQATVLAAHEKGSFTHLVAGSTAMGKSVMPRVAAALDVAAITEVTAVESEDTFQRPIYAGNAISTVKALDAVKVLTVRPPSFDKPAQGSAAAPVEALEVAVPKDGPSWFVGQALSKSERPELATAGTVVSGGRGLKSGDNFHLLESLADQLGAALGASRAAVDAGFAPNDWQVGQTGKVVAPDLYIAVGISGAIQHLAGMKDSKTIVAINTDPDAPIFQVADYGVVDDLFKVCPELDAKLKALKK